MRDDTRATLPSAFMHLASQLTLPRDRDGTLCVSSLRIDGMGQQIYTHIYYRVIARVLHLPFCSWRLVEPRQRTIKVHPRAGSAEWTNELNLCGLMALPRDPVDSGDCGYALNCMGCSICNCPMVNATGHRTRGVRNRILKATLLKMVETVDKHISQNHELWAGSDWRRAVTLAALQVRDELLLQRSLISAAVPPPTCPMYQSGLLHVAMHARRGDVMSNDKKVHRRVPDDFYRQLLSRVNELLTGNRLAHVLHIFSEGIAPDFVAMTAGLPSVRLHLNGNDFAAWHCLGRADLLLTSGSGAYSLTAAFFASVDTHVLYSQWETYHIQALRRLGYSNDKGVNAAYELNDARYRAMIAEGLGWHKVFPNGSAEGEADYIHALRQRARPGQP